MRRLLISIVFSLCCLVSRGQDLKRHAITVGVLGINSSRDNMLPVSRDELRVSTGEPYSFNYVNAVLYTYAINAHVRVRAKVRRLRHDYRRDGGYTGENVTGNGLEAGIGAQYGRTFRNRLHLYAGAEAIAINTRLAGTFYSDVQPFSGEVAYRGRLYGANLLVGAEWQIHRNVSLLVEPGFVLGSARVTRTVSGSSTQTNPFRQYLNPVSLLGISVKL